MDLRHVIEVLADLITALRNEKLVLEAKVKDLQARLDGEKDK